MSTKYSDTSFFDSLSFGGIAQSAIGQGVEVGNLGWSLVSINALSRYVDATDTSAGNAQRRLYTLVFDLIQRGILKGSAS
jgi:hypothetical protein